MLLVVWNLKDFSPVVKINLSVSKFMDTLESVVIRLLITDCNKNGKFKNQHAKLYNNIVFTCLYCGHLFQRVYF